MGVNLSAFHVFTLRQKYFQEPKDMMQGKDVLMLQCDISRWKIIIFLDFWNS